MSTGSLPPRTSTTTAHDSSLAEPVVVDINLRRRAAEALDGAIAQLLAQQREDGHWCAELEGDSILQSEYILLKWIIGQENDPRLPKVARFLRSQQRDSDGAWHQYPGAKPDVSATVKAYFALKLMGDDPDADHMRRARELIHKLGGAEQCNTYSRYYLAMLGQLHYDNVPAVPPEVVFLPKLSYFHLNKISSWSRVILMPLAIVTTYRPVRKLRPEQGIAELFNNRDFMTRPMMELDPRLITWKNLFLTIDKALKIFDKTKLHRINPLRSKALKLVERWLIERMKHSDGPGAIYPSMVNLIIAFRCLGYEWSNPLLAETCHQLDRLMIEDEDTIRFQPCFSPVWDSGIAAYALTEAGLDAKDEPMRRATDWLLAKECRHVVGDWKANVPEEVEPSGWFFEYENAFFPDVDDTAMVVMALQRTGGGTNVRQAVRRGIEWMFAMQCDDGGWAAFDRTVDRPILERVPFADHNAIQDPSCADITGRVLECFGHFGYRPDHPAIAKAIRYLQAKQEPEGCWYGRWGVNYVYGSFQVLCGLRTIGVDMSEVWVQQAGRWLRSVQKPDGSFGESADTYEHPELKGQGPSTASQTAWGTMGLMAVFGPRDPAVQRGIRWLIDTQLPSGTWEEKWFTGTGFPRVFYLRYHLYRLYFPLMCLGRWTRAIEQA